MRVNRRTKNPVEVNTPGAPRRAAVSAPRPEAAESPGLQENLRVRRPKPVRSAAAPQQAIAGSPESGGGKTYAGSIRRQRRDRVKPRRAGLQQVAKSCAAARGAEPRAPKEAGVNGPTSEAHGERSGHCVTVEEDPRPAEQLNGRRAGSTAPAVEARVSWLRCAARSPAQRPAAGSHQVQPWSSSSDAAPASQPSWTLLVGAAGPQARRQAVCAEPRLGRCRRRSDTERRSVSGTGIYSRRPTAMEQLRRGSGARRGPASTSTP